MLLRRATVNTPIIVILPDAHLRALKSLNYTCSTRRKQVRRNSLPQLPVPPVFVVAQHLLNRRSVAMDT